MIDNQVIPKNNISTSPPSTGNDDSQGYSRGSLWFRSVTKSFYICQEATTGAAIWQNQNKRDITFSYFSTTNDSYQPFVYFYAGEKPFNKFTVTTYGDYKVQLYNVTTAGAIQESGTISSGTNTTTVNITGAPFNISSLNLIRAEIK